MDGQNYLGIYLGKSTATVVCLNLHGRQKSLVGCFSVSVEQQDDKQQQLANLVAEGCAARGFEFEQAVVALDCEMFMQHKVHSEFSDPKQIAATVRFDTEEALAADISNAAIAFKVVSIAPEGSNLTVFTAQHKILSEIIVSFQNSSIDPVSIEPDVNCLSRFLSRNVIGTKFASEPAFFALFSNTNGYVVVFSQNHRELAMRTFLSGPAQGKEQVLIREVPLTLALIDSEETVNCLKVFDSTGSVDYRQLNEKLGIEADFLDLAGCAPVKPENLAECDNLVAFAIAYGAGLAHLEKAQNVNFRNDFMPYMGKKLKLQKTLKFMSISLVVFLISLGLYLQIKLMQKNRPTKQLREQFAGQYSAIMMGQPIPEKISPLDKLKGEVRRIVNVKSGRLSVTGEQSVTAKLTLVLAAFNKCASQTDLKVDKITVTSKNISITGSTSGRKNTLKLFEEIKKGGLKILDYRYDLEGGRDVFAVKVLCGK